MTRLDDPFAIIAFAASIIMTIVMFVVVGRVHRVTRRLGEKDYDAAEARRVMNRMMGWVGVWEISIGLVLISFGSGVNAASLIGLGIIFMAGSHFRVFAGGWDRHR